MGCCASNDASAPPPEESSSKPRENIGGDEDPKATDEKKDKPTGDDGKKKASDGGSSPARGASPSPARAAPSSSSRATPDGTAAGGHRGRASPTPAADGTPTPSGVPPPARRSMSSGAYVTDGDDADTSPARKSSFSRRPSTRAKSVVAVPRDAAAVEQWRRGDQGAVPPTWAGWHSRVAPPVESATAWPVTGLLVAPETPQSPNGTTADVDSYNTRALAMRILGSATADPEAFNYGFDMLKYGRKKLADDAALEERRRQRAEQEEKLFGGSRPASAGSRRSGGLPSRPHSAHGVRPEGAADEAQLLAALDAELDFSDGGDEDFSTVLSLGGGSPNRSRANANNVSTDASAYLNTTAIRSITMARARERAGPVAPIVPDIPMQAEDTREYDSDEEPLAEVAYDDMFRVSSAAAQARGGRPRDDSGFVRRHQRAPSESSQRSVGEDEVRLATPGFVAVEEDCRRVLTGRGVAREFLESAPRWTPSGTPEQQRATSPGATGGLSASRRRGRRSSTERIASLGAPRAHGPDGLSLEDLRVAASTGRPPRPRRQGATTAPEYDPWDHAVTSDDDGDEGNVADAEGLGGGPAAKYRVAAGDDGTSDDDDDDIDAKLAAAAARSQLGRHDDAFDTSNVSGAAARRGGPVGVAAPDEFLSAQRRVIAVALPTLALGMEETARREELRATWAARAHMAFCGMQSVVMFLQHREALELGLRQHAAVLINARARLMLTEKIEQCHVANLERARLLYSGDVRRMLFQQQHERDIEAAKARREAAKQAEKASAFERSVIRQDAWTRDKAALIARAEKSDLAATSEELARRKAAEQERREKSMDPLRTALEVTLNTMAAEEAGSATDDTKDGTSTSSILITQSPKKSDAPAAMPNTTTAAAAEEATGSVGFMAAVDNMSYRRKKLLESMQRMSVAESRSRAAVQLEAAKRLDSVYDQASRVLPVPSSPTSKKENGGADYQAAELLQHRRDAELCEAKLRKRAAERRVEDVQMSAQALQLKLRDERLLDALRARCAILEKESDDCRALVESQEAQSRELIAMNEQNCRAVAHAHDMRAAARRQREEFLVEKERRKAAALSLLGAIGYGAIVRRRLRLVTGVSDEARAIVDDQRRQSKQLLQSEKISFYDVAQFFVCTAPRPSEMVAMEHVRGAVASPDCVPAVESLARRRIALEEAAIAEEFERYHERKIYEANNIPPEMVGARERASVKIQGLWRGVRLRIIFRREMRDKLTFDRMRRLKARMAVRGAQEIEELHRLRIQEEEAAAFADLTGPQLEAGARHVGDRLAAAMAVQRLFRGFHCRKRVVPDAKEAYWLKRYRQTQRQ